MKRGRKPGSKNKQSLTKDLLKERKIEQTKENKHIGSKFDDCPTGVKLDIKCPVKENVQQKLDITKNETKVELTKELEDKLIKAKATMNTINKSMGANTVTFACSEEVKERALFGVEAIDTLTGGIPFGAFSIIYGSKSCTKTTLAYLAIAQAQKLGKICAHWDLEGSYDEEWACKMGVNKDNLILGRFENAEQAMDALIKLAKEEAIDFIVIDSVQALSPTSEQTTKGGVEKSVEDDSIALLARKLSQFFRMANSGIFKAKIGVLLIGQSRMDLGSFIKLETLSGGHALAHWATWIVHVRRGQKADAPQYKYKDNENKTQTIQLGFDVCAKLTKTKISGTAIEGTETHVPFYFGYAFTKPTEQQIKETFLQTLVEEEKAFEELEKNEKI